MSKPKTVTGTIRLAPETWVKLRELFQYYGGAGVVKTAWFTRWIEKQHEKMIDKKRGNDADSK